MITYVLLLRGINVGGHRKLLMNDLKLLLTEIGFLNISTYIQSGNAVFQLKNQTSQLVLEKKVAEAILEKYNYEVPVIIIDAFSLEKLIDLNPFKEDTSIEKLHCTFLKTQPLSANIEKLNTQNFSPDSCYVVGKSAFIKCDFKYSKSKLTNGFLEKNIGVRCTTRNWKTTLKLMEMCKSLD